MTLSPRLPVFAVLLPILAGGPAEAQWYPGIDEGPRFVRPFRYEDDGRAWREPAERTPYRPWQESGPQERPVYRQTLPPEHTGPPTASPLAGLDERRIPGPKLLDGGPRPDVTPLPPQAVPFPWRYPAGTIIIETQARQLFLVGGNGSALRYPISVGREGFQWTGTEKISRIADWPDWHPPEEMRKRQPWLPEKMTGGLHNPLGAKSLYLGNSLYRIHGTNDPKTVGHASSSGCFRMLNGHVADLARRIAVGSTVIVLDRLPRGAAVGAYDDRRREPPAAYRSRQRSVWE